MARRKSRGSAAEKAAAPSIVRFLPIAILAALVVFVGAVVVVFFTSPEPGVFHYPLEENLAGCMPGQARGCTVGNCSGTSLCLEGGTWSGCRWEHVCAPGARIPCLKDGCSYAYRDCNACGSGYGDCTVPSSAK